MSWGRRGGGGGGAWPVGGSSVDAGVLGGGVALPAASFAPALGVAAPFGARASSMSWLHGAGGSLPDDDVLARARNQSGPERARAAR